MKTITILEITDLTFLKEQFGYFFDGNGGWFLRKKLPAYGTSFDVADLIKLSDCLKNTTDDDYNELVDYIEKQLESDKQQVKHLKEQISGYIETINRRTDALEIVKSKTTLPEAMRAVLRLKV